MRLFGGARAIAAYGSAESCMHTAASGGTQHKGTQLLPAFTSVTLTLPRCSLQPAVAAQWPGSKAVSPSANAVRVVVIGTCSQGQLDLAYQGCASRQQRSSGHRAQAAGDQQAQHVRSQHTGHEACVHPCQRRTGAQHDQSVPGALLTAPCTAVHGHPCYAGC